MELLFGVLIFVVFTIVFVVYAMTMVNSIINCIDHFLAGRKARGFGNVLLALFCFVALGVLIVCLCLSFVYTQPALSYL